MIVPMKKASLIIRSGDREKTLKKLRRLGIMHIEIAEGSGERLEELKSRMQLLEGALFACERKKKPAQRKLDAKQALLAAEELMSLGERKKLLTAQAARVKTEFDRIKEWGDIDPHKIKELEKSGVRLAFYEMPKSEYAQLGEDVSTVRIESGKSSVKFMTVELRGEAAEDDSPIPPIYRFSLPERSTGEMLDSLSGLFEASEETDKKIEAFSECADAFRRAVDDIAKQIEFETYATGMASQSFSCEGAQGVELAYFTGYIEAQRVGELKKAAAQNSWGLVIEEPTEEDNVPTELKNNKLVSLIYPLTDFLGTVPGYFEFDISGWFLAFILIFFGIIFGDGGYGLFICLICAAAIIKSLKAKKTPSRAVLLITLFGASTILWGTLTCTWFGLSPEQLPEWLKALSVPVISNVYESRIWQPFWCTGAQGLTTAQNVQILCFTLALIQLTVAHIMCFVRNIRSLRLLGDIGSIMQLFGVYYVVLSLVVNSEVFSLGLVIGSVPIGTAAIISVGVGFALSFIFSNYEGSILKSVLTSLKNIVSVLLGVVNMFSDIVSYIRLWAVGLAGAAISATVNELAGPLLGNFMFMVLAIVLLVFGHGLNMILNVLSVIVHGIRLNTLEFSSHLDMSWSGHKFKPFKEQID